MDVHPDYVLVEDASVQLLQKLSLEKLDRPALFKVVYTDNGGYQLEKVAEMGQWWPPAGQTE